MSDHGPRGAPAIPVCSEAVGAQRRGFGPWPSESCLHARSCTLRCERTARSAATVAPIERLPERLLSSWQRSEQYGVSLEEIEPVFSGTFDQDSLFFECGQEVLTGLHRTLAAEPISLMLTDADGVVLSRIVRRADLAAPAR